MDIELPLMPSCFILGILPKDVEDNQIILPRALLLIAKKIITISWIRPQPPTITQWRQKVR